MNKLPVENEKNEVDYIKECIGDFGVWQAIVCLLASLLRVINIWNIAGIVFLTPKSVFYCAILESNATVVEKSKCYDSCIEYRYENEYFTETLISQFGLICERQWLASFVQTSLTFGIFVGAITFGWISDRYGRRRAILLCILGNVLFMLSTSFVTTLWLFILLRFLTGITTAGVAVTSAVVVVETSGPKYRTIAGCLMSTADALGQITLAAFGYFSSTWRQMLFEISLVVACFWPYAFLFPESPRWLISKGKREEAVAVLTKAAKWNNKDTENIPSYVEAMINSMAIRSDISKKPNLIDLFRHRKSVTRTCQAFAIWFATGTCFFGVNQYITFIGVNIYITVLVAGVVQLPGPPVAIILNKYFGRKYTTIGTSSLFGLSMIALTFIPKHHWLSTTLGLIGLYFIGMTFTTIYLYTSELYPTTVRNMGLGIANSGAKFGAMLAPFAANLQPRWLPTIIFSTLPYLASFVCYFLPETRDKKLEETLND